MRQLVYDKIKTRINLSLEEFLFHTIDWEFIPCYHKDKLKAIVMRKNKEVHIISFSSLSSVRSFIKEILKSTFRKFGGVITVVSNEYSIGHKLANLLNFEQVSKDNNHTLYKLRRDNVWCS